jgi:4-amino-4-deoxy-L-arabinose transferase-like glycosyltransferase
VLKDNSLAAIVLILILMLPFLTLCLDTFPPLWYDEGFRTNAARTLAERGMFGTYSADGFHPFDPATTSGPLDIASVALSFRLLGIGVTQARLAILPYTVVALFSLYGVSVYIYGRKAALFSIVMLLAVPAFQDVGLVLLSRQVMGEVPALALIVLGLWLWFRSWKAERGLWLSALAGGIMGLGLLSKTQTAIALLPALFLIAAGRSLRDRSYILKLFAPIITIVGVMAIWKLFELLATPAPIWRENNLELAEALQTLLLTNLFGRSLTRGGMFIIAIMIAGVIASGWRLVRVPHAMRFKTNEQWAEAVLALFVLFSALWFAFLSIGWTRYAFMGWVIGLLLIGKLGWDLLGQLCRWLELRLHKPGIEQYGNLAALVCLVIIVVFTNGYPLIRGQGDNTAQQVANYIRAEIPPEAVIESWEWELDALSSHWNFHHPDIRYQFLADRQRFHEQKPFDLNYDTLQADPDYLITGPFSDWTTVYNAQVVNANFTKLAEIGLYRIYGRIR